MLETNQVYNIDCLEGMKQINDKSVDLILTDPPYNTGMTSIVSNSDGLRLKNFFDDDYTVDEYDNLVMNFCEHSFRILKDDRACYVFINWKSLGIWLNHLSKAGFVIKNVIVWDKIVHGLNYQNYSYTYELIIFCVKGNFRPRNKNLKDINDGFYKDVWHLQREINFVSDHETVKPIELLRIILCHASFEGDIVFDGFFGVGSTGVACKQLKRVYIGMEVSKEYCDIAVKRLSQTQLFNFDDGGVFEWEEKTV